MDRQRRNRCLRYSAINTLLLSRPIKFLALDGMSGEDDDDVKSFLDLVRQSTSLRILRCEIDREGFSSSQLEELGKALTTSVSLESLRFNVGPDADLTPVAEALRNNRALIGLHITGFQEEPIPDLSAFATVLETSNSTLKSMIIGSCNLSMCSTSSSAGTSRSEKLNRIGALLQDNIARSRPPPLPKPCYNPA